MHVLMGKREGWRPRSRPRCGWEGNVRWIILGGCRLDLIQNRDRCQTLRNAAM